MKGAQPSKTWLFGFLTALFLGLIGYFSTTAFEDYRPPKPQQLQQEWYKIETARGEIRANSLSGNCHICHALWVTIPRSKQNSEPRFAHLNIQLSHGTNDRCYNCHHIADRNKYVADDGSTIMVETPDKLCARCHGLIHKDWLAGTHGKRVGRAVSVGLFDQLNLTCTECHSPHAPAFEYKMIAPPPVWAQKYIRTPLEHTENSQGVEYLFKRPPEEIF